MLELDCTAITPQDVLKTSGHVKKFLDVLCMDVKTGDTFKANHVIREALVARLKFHEGMLNEGTRILYELGEYKQSTERQVLSDDQIQTYHKVLAEVGDLSLESLGPNKY